MQSRFGNKVPHPFSVRIVLKHDKKNKDVDSYTQFVHDVDSINFDASSRTYQLQSSDKSVLHTVTIDEFERIELPV